MIYKEFLPHPCLRPYIECYWKAVSHAPPFRKEESLIPDGTIELMFNYGDDYHHIKRGNKETVKGSHIIGIRKHALRISQTSNQCIFSVRFKPGGAFPFFGIPTHLFANGFWDLYDLGGRECRELEEQLYEADDEERVQLANRFFMHQLKTDNNAYALTASCARWLLEQDSRSVAEASRVFGVSYKTLERKFSTVIGLTPRELIKIQRFNRVILAMYSCRHQTLTAAAYACGYYDQSHFIREFRQLSGLSPREFLKEQYTIVQVIQPALADRLSKSYNF